ncbi:Olfactory receptor 5 [Cricetulus griseus]|uniref:Olfactory receptor 5 n=1 Tax=Cricetulus griseus TaxID=10029 RepID=G3IIL3_CRIGR|nr:Olfactory receptor 5 [Cricetulus griseus]
MTRVQQFILLGLSTRLDIRDALFAVFLTLYLLTLLENTLIIYLVCSHSELHKPMYFFLGNLSCLEICYVSVTMPTLLVGLWTGPYHISFTLCMTQLFFFIVLICTECTLLASMAYDRYVAICRPLHYPSSSLHLLPPQPHQVHGPQQDGDVTRGHQHDQGPAICALRLVHKAGDKGRPVCRLPGSLPADAPGERSHHLPRLQSQRAPQAYVLLPGQPQLPGDVLRVGHHAHPTRGAVDGALPYFLYTLHDPALLLRLSNVLNQFFCDVSPLLNLSCTHVALTELVDFISAIVIFCGTLLVSLASYSAIGMAVLRMPSAAARRKAFSTCASHLVVVGIFYSAALFIYCRPSRIKSMDLNKVLSVVYTVVTPLCNPVIYCLRNKEVHTVLRKTLRWP